MLYGSPRGAGGGFQHPGSPGCPQHACRLLILIQVFANATLSFLPNGRSELRQFPIPAAGLGEWWL
jgi:hypothetical protein